MPACLTLLFLLLEPKLLLFLLLITIAIVLVFVLFHVTAYGLGLGASLLMTFISGKRLPSIRKQTMTAYLGTTAHGLTRARDADRRVGPLGHFSCSASSQKNMTMQPMRTMSIRWLMKTIIRC